MTKAPIWGLYAITPEGLPIDTLLSRTRAILDGGARILQYRAKQVRPDQKKEEALALQGLARDLGKLFIINDDLDLACELQSDGVHLGRHDPPLTDARRVFSGMIGVSCYASLERAEEAVRLGADYLAFGSMASSSSKPEAPPCPIDVLAQAKAWGKPIVAIGGITLDNARSILEAGADSLAVISALYSSENPRTTSQQFSQLWRANLNES